MRRPGSRRNAAEDPERGPRRGWSPLAVAAVAAAVLIAGGGGAYVVASGQDGGASQAGSGSPGGGGTPPPALGPPPGIAPGEPNPFGVLYRAGVALPDGPSSAAVYRVNGTVTAAEVTRLAGSLGLAGAPERDGAAWRAGPEQDGSGPVLRVGTGAPGTWTFTRYGPSPGGDNCLRGRSCPGGGGTAGGDQDAAVSERAAKQAAAPVLAALGQQSADLDARQLIGAVRVVNADPRIGGLPTHGRPTRIEVAAGGQVTGGGGQLTAPARSRTYPVTGAEAALAELNKAARETGGCATPVPLDGGEKTAPPCRPASGSPAKPLVITGAVFGLAAHPLDGGPALVPSWLFEVAPGGGALPYTVTQPAIAPELLTRPAPPGGPGAPTTAPIESYSTNGQSLTLHFWGGVCSDYTGRADEGGTAVKVTVLAHLRDPAAVCPAIAKRLTVTVGLSTPLGGRQVVDAATGERVPRG